MAESRVGGDVKAVFVGCALLMVALALVDNGALAWLLFPVILAGLVFCMARAPLRHSLMTLMFLAFTIDYQTEAFGGGEFRTPFFNVGNALFEHLNVLTGVKALFFSGSDIILLTLGIVAFMRERSGSTIDRADRVPTPRIQVRLAWVALLGAGYVWIAGMLRGGDFNMSLWQLQRVIYLPLLFLLWQVALRGPKDIRALGKVLITAAMIKAALAVYIVKTVVPEKDPMTGIAQLATATTHSDSMLFATATVVVLLMVIERASPKARRNALLILPLLVWGMIANHRRLVWVHIALMMVTLYAVTPDNIYKRKARRYLAYASPLLLIYTAAGWNSQYGRLFKPVRIARSIIEPSTDTSSLWRELENYNLIVTLKQSPFFGYGYGRPFVEAVQMPAVNYSLEYYCPHNSLLGLFAFGGYLGFTAMTIMWGVGVYFAMRAYHSASAPIERVAAIAIVGAVLVYLVQAFGDLGLGSLAGVHIVAPALAIAGKLASANGGWGMAQPPRAVAAAPGASIAAVRHHPFPHPAGGPR
jgi:hypothetical protein